MLSKSHLASFMLRDSMLHAVETTLRVIESGFGHLANQPTVGLYYLRVRGLGLGSMLYCTGARRA